MASRTHLTMAGYAIFECLKGRQGKPSSKRDIAAMTGLHVRTVDDQIRCLRKLGMVVAKATYAESGMQRENVYLVPDIGYGRKAVDADALEELLLVG